MPETTKKQIELKRAIEMSFSDTTSPAAVQDAANVEHLESTLPSSDKRSNVLENIAGASVVLTVGGF